MVPQNTSKYGTSRKAMAAMSRHAPQPGRAHWLLLAACLLMHLELRSGHRLDEDLWKRQEGAVKRFLASETMRCDFPVVDAGELTAATPVKG